MLLLFYFLPTIILHYEARGSDLVSSPAAASQEELLAPYKRRVNALFVRFGRDARDASK